MRRKASNIQETTPAAADGVMKRRTSPGAAKPTARDKKNPHAAALGRLGGLKGGRARAKALSAQERRTIARKAARARWQKPRAPKR
jgi:hypothetical protein